MSAPATSLGFRVHRCEPELITPARPTPRELKKLSGIDEQESLRFHQDVVHFYANDVVVRGMRDPVRAIREALGLALVFYYPLAGRVREGPGRELHVDCTGEGVVFMEADADVELEQFGCPLQPPFPCFEELLYVVPGTTNVLNSPLFHFQVTRLKCNGFIIALRFNHTVTDGFGLTQFLNAICELARGATSPSISPVWRRELFCEPHMTCTSPEYDKISPFRDDDNVIDRSFFFGSSHLSAIRKCMPQHLLQSSEFDLLTACLWRCRARALDHLDPDDKVHLHLVVNARGRLNPPVPIGYYGNTSAIPTAVATAGMLSKSPFEYAVELVRDTKESVTGECIKSKSGLLASARGPPFNSMANSLFVYKTNRLGLHELDYGWGMPLFGGPPGTVKGLFSCYTWFRDEEGEVGRLVTCGLPARAMDRFVEELDHMVRPRAGVTSCL